MIASWTCPWCGEKAHRNGEACLHAEARIQRVTLGQPNDAPSPPSDNQSPSGALGAKASNDGPSGDVHAGGNQTSAPAPDPCFWPRCSNHLRCEAFGSCVAIAQRNALRDEGKLMTAAEVAAQGPEERPAFEVRYRDFPDSDAYRVYASGRIEGFGVASVVFNRIPQLLARARADSWAEAVASMAERRPRPRPPRGHQPDDAEIRWWAGFGCGVATTAIIAILAVLLGFR